MREFTLREFCPLCVIFTPVVGARHLCRFNVALQIHDEAG
jgi:hypothetical protein